MLSPDLEPVIISHAYPPTRDNITTLLWVTVSIYVYNNLDIINNHCIDSVGGLYICPKILHCVELCDMCMSLSNIVVMK
jgi:hypothetical protein